MSPFKKCEASSAKGSKRCNLIKMQGSFNPGGGSNGGAMRGLGDIHTRFIPKGFKYICLFFFFFLLPIPAACVG